jgi:tetratricopeptide (TPR) repeat protein
MSRRSDDWSDDRESYGPRSIRGSGGAPQDGGRRRLSNSQVASALREAQQLQQDGNLDDAVQLCEEILDNGIDRADVRYFLGWLYQETDHWDEAAGQFELLLNDPEYALSCYYALGQCARAQGDMEGAAHYFDEAVDRVNLDALTIEESDQLLQLCQEAAEAHREMNDLEGAETIYTALLGFLRSQGWQDQVSEVERLMRETLGTEPPPQRRRRTADPSRPVGRNMPQRPGTRSAAPTRQPPEAEPAIQPGGTGTPLPVADDSDSPPFLISDQIPAAPGAGDLRSFGVGSSNFVSDPFAAAAPSSLYGGSQPGIAGSDQLAHLIHNLGTGMSGIRSGLGTVPEPQRAQVAQAVRDIENYVAHGLLTAAIEECLRVMEVAPQYLDVHLMLAEIYVRQGQIEQAIAKYAVLVDTYLLNNRIDDAIGTYRRILQLEPNNLNYRVKLIELLSRQGRMDEVLVERMATADAYLRQGYADRAIQEYEQALLSSSNNTQVRLNYARALMKAGRAQQAAGEYQRILQVDPRNLNALCQWQIALASGVGMPPSMSMSTPGAGSNRVAALEVLTRLLRGLRADHQRSYEDIVREYLQALDAAPANVDLRYALGMVHLATGHQQEAVTSFQQAAAAPGLEVLARYGAGLAYLLTADPVNATHAVRELEDASAAIRRVPVDPALWAARPRLDGEEHLAPEIEVSQLLGRAYQLSGQVSQAQSTLQAANQQRAYNDEVYQALAEVSARVGDPQAAQQEYAQLARHYRTNRQVENAVTVLREMARIAPEDPSVHSELADIHVSRGLLDEGLAELRQLGEIHVRRGQLREAALVYQRMAEIDWGTGERTEALNLLRQAIQYSTDDMALRQQFVQYCLEVGITEEAGEQQAVIARYYFASRQTKEAVAALQQLIGMDPHNYEAYDLLGQTYYSVGEYEQAARVYRNLARVNPSSQMARARLQELQAVRSQMR